MTHSTPMADGAEDGSPPEASASNSASNFVSSRKQIPSVSTNSHSDLISSDSPSNQTNTLLSSEECHPLFIKWLPKETSDSDLRAMFSKWRSVGDLCLFQWVATNSFKYAVVVFGDKAELTEALVQLQKPHIGLCNYQPFFWEERPPSLWCLRESEVTFAVNNNGFETQFHDWDIMQVGRRERDTITPGCMAMLPLYQCRRPEFYYDPELEYGAFEHPVIILGHWGDGFYPIVVVTTSNYI
ncbi:hypothetical protein EG329_000338 [Mollisiaceae sp. DMI_Dod_QoI]|nr:hypothetical protein EG329_000338 [Helotiales sp. DMI_Dod_QoI]